MKITIKYDLALNCLEIKLLFAYFQLQEILYDDVFIQYAQHPQMYHILTQLIGDDVTAIHSMFINKPPGTGRHPPHQVTTILVIDYTYHQRHLSPTTLITNNTYYQQQLSPTTIITYNTRQCLHLLHAAPTDVPHSNAADR